MRCDFSVVATLIPLILSADRYYYRKNDLIFIRPYFTLSVVKNNKPPLHPCCKAAHLYD